MDLARIKATLERAGVAFERGLDDDELRAVEAKYRFRFPPDLAAFLAYALPISKSWVNWRSADERTLVERLAWPYDGICFDVEENDFWLDEWGARPDELDDAFAIVKQAVDRAPKLIPICSHRYLPDRPHAAAADTTCAHRRVASISGPGSSSSTSSTPRRTGGGGSRGVGPVSTFGPPPGKRTQ